MIARDTTTVLFRVSYFVDIQPAWLPAFSPSRDVAPCSIDSGGDNLIVRKTARWSGSSVFVGVERVSSLPW